jgi:hypothetical protein
MTAPQSNQDWIQVAEVGQVWQAELIVGRLRAGGIDAQIVDQTFHQEPVPNVRALAVVRVFVRSEQLEETRRLLNQALELPDDVDVTSAEDDGEPGERSD